MSVNIKVLVLFVKPILSKFKISFGNWRSAKSFSFQIQFKNQKLSYFFILGTLSLSLIITIWLPFPSTAMLTSLVLPLPSKFLFLSLSVIFLMIFSITQFGCWENEGK